nr:PAS domain-containing protein [Bacteroidota bacterium]
LKFRLLAEFTHDWEYWIDPAGKYIYTSPACKRITGYSSEELITNQTLFMDLVHPGFKEKIGDHFKNEISDSRSLAKIEFPIINRNGETIWLEHTCSPIFDEQNKHLGRRGSNRDITQRIQSEERLRINESRLIEAQRIGKLGSLDWNLITNEIEISAETIRIYGLDPANNKPQVEEIVKCVHPDDLERVNQSLKAAVTEEAQHEG